jgi:hypothetical protein
VRFKVQCLKNQQCTSLQYLLINPTAHTTMNKLDTTTQGIFTKLHHSTQQYITVHNTTQQYTTQHNSTQHNTTVHNTTPQYTTVHNTTQHNSTQHNTTVHNSTQHNTTQQYTTQHHSIQTQEPTQSELCNNSVTYFTTIYYCDTKFNEF